MSRGSPLERLRSLRRLERAASVLGKIEGTPRERQWSRLAELAGDALRERRQDALELGARIEDIETAIAAGLELGRRPTIPFHIEAKAAAAAVANVVAYFPSASTPELVHEVRRGEDGALYCTCPRWIYQRRRPSERQACAHVERVRAGVVTLLLLFAAELVAGDAASEPRRRPRAPAPAAMEARSVVAGGAGIACILTATPLLALSAIVVAGADTGDKRLVAVPWLLSSVGLFSAGVGLAALGFASVRVEVTSSSVRAAITF